MTEEPFARDRELYERTKNPLYVWSVLASASLDWSAPLPSWVAKYLRDTALALRRIKMSPTPEAGKMLRALGLVKGRLNMFAEMHKDNEAAWAALDSAYFGGGDEAAETLALEQGAKFSTEIEAIKQRIRRKVRRARDTGRSIR